MVEMVILRAVVAVQREINSGVQWLSFLRNVGEGEALCIPGGVLCARSFFFQSLCGFQFP